VKRSTDKRPCECRKPIRFERADGSVSCLRCRGQVKAEEEKR
jgi:hypothetical protein